MSGGGKAWQPVPQVARASCSSAVAAEAGGFWTASIDGYAAAITAIAATAQNAATTRLYGGIEAMLTYGFHAF
jgi:hypothetical protein